ncbi:MAG: nuclear transport factor 2 family protein [Acidimicrobiales bacterium]
MHGERIIGREAFVAVQDRYPTPTGHWTFDIHRIVVDGATAVSEVSVTDGTQSARVVAISTVEDGLITAQTEYWPTRYDPPHDRSDVTVPGPQIP